MNIEEKYKLLVEKITKRAEQNICREEEDFDLYSCCGGNYDDAYSIGVDNCCQII